MYIERKKKKEKQINSFAQQSNKKDILLTVSRFF